MSPKAPPAFKKQQEEDQTVARWQAENLIFICHVLSKMKGSKNLHINFYDDTGRSSEMSLLDPLMSIKNVENFDVELTWALERAVDP
ncbi:hypothetical protein BPOR_0134g00100 [Botrytis porri]|uniref:Uncharacterized protein n=1 Tax=Botrytis porri TaxID=87229 RepID=A0A4Z1KX45_9HELO|nr:hypothetical protein BPOR_0134g00100 [Botrytis porri]